MGVDPYIHPKAHVEFCYIGSGTKVWQFASVIRGASIGKNCTIGSCAIVDGSRIGDNCSIGPGVDMGPGFLVGNDVFIGPNVVFCNDMWPRASKDGFDMKALQAGLVAIHVKDGASIGANATLLPGITIGRNAMVAASVVAGVDVPDDHLLDRNGDIRLIRDEWRERRMRHV